MKKVDPSHIDEIKSSLGEMAAQAQKWEKIQTIEAKLTAEERKLLLAEAEKYGYDTKIINDYTER